MPLLNFTQYAKHRKEKGLSGTTQQAVSWAVDEGRCPVVINKKGRRYIDRDAADKAWDENSDYSKRPDFKKSRQARKEGAADIVSDPDAGAATRGIPTITQSKAIKEAFLARTAKLEYERLAGKTISLEEAAKEWLRVSGAVKTKMLGLTSRLKSKLPHLSHSDVALIDEEIRESLADLATMKGVG